MQLRWDVFVIAVVYVLVVSIGIGLYLARRRVGRTGESFLFGDKALGPWVAGITIALAGIGSLHTVGMMEAGGTLGLVALWFSVAAGFVKAIDGAFLAPFYRKLGLNTVPEILGRLFDTKTRIMASIIGLFIAWGILSLETQGGGLVLSGITGVDVRLALFIFIVCAAAYIMISGMWQVAYLNFINMILTYVAVVASFVIVSAKLPGGWTGIESTYLAKGMTSTLSFWPSDPALLLGYAFAIVIALVCSDSIDQGMMQYALSARNVKGARNAFFISVFFNVPFAFFTISFGLAAMALPEFATYGPKTAGIAMVLNWLPTLLAGVLLAAFLVIVLSTWARFSMGISQILINDFYLPFAKGENKQAAIPLLSRLFILIPGVATIIPAYFLPHILLTGLFVFALAIPVFVMMLLGLFWKRNAEAAFWTMVPTLILSFIWQYSSLPKVLGAPEWFGVPYLSLIVSLILGVGLTLALPGEKGLFARGAAPGGVPAGHGQ